MALKYIDGFEQIIAGYNYNYLLMNSNTITQYKWTQVSGGAEVSLVNGYYRTPQTNAMSFRIYSARGLFMQIPTNATVIVGFGHSPQAILSDSWCFFNFNNSLVSRNTSAGLHFDIMADGSIRAYNEATNSVIQQSSPGVVTYATWRYIEIKVSFGLNGSVEVRINGETVISVSNVDTLCGLASVTGLNLTNTVDGYFDDFYICDTSGTSCNDFLGPISVYTLFPDANGSVNNFTAVGAGSNYAAVNNQIPTTASYVQSNVTGHKDLYSVPNLPMNTGVVHGVQVRSYMQKIDNGARSTQILLKTSGTEANSGNFAATMGTWLNAWTVFEKQADGITAWDIAAVNAMEIGHKNT